MKAVLTLLAVALLAWAFAPVASAQVIGDEAVWYDADDNGVFDQATDVCWAGDDEDALARVVRYGDMIDSACNKETWRVSVHVSASVAQWVEWSLNKQGWEWYVMKPGRYAANCISFTIASNGDIKIDYENFADLLGDNTHNATIPTYYSYGNNINEAEENGWVAATDLNGDDDTLDESALNVEPFNLHDGIDFKLWNKIEVVDCNTACEYTNDADIYIILTQQKDWVDPDGGWLVDNTPVPVNTVVQ
jgi:hypothetical protein